MAEEAMQKKINQKEFDKALELANRSRGTYTHRFSTPFEHEGTTYEELHFDFSNLKGRDALKIYTELRMLGIPTVVPSLSDDFKIRMAARACKEKIGTDAFEAMPIKDYLDIVGEVRSFLMRSGS